MGCNCPCDIIESASWATTPDLRARKRFGGTMMSDKRTWQVCLRAPTVSFMMDLARQCACFILGLGPVPTDGGFDEPVGRRTGCSTGRPQERLFIRHRLQRFPAGVIRSHPNISPPLIKSGCQPLARS